MDAAFLEELNKQITGVGTEKVWKKQIGDRVVWFAPIDVARQAKVVETLKQVDMGTDAWDDAKRVGLAAAIVGLDELDLRGYRHAGNVFPIQTRDGKTKQVDLATFIYHKISTWDSDFFDIAYDVMGDLMESHRKACLQGIKFENVKDPREELLELEQRVAELRERLRMPPLVEAGAEATPTEEDRERRERLESDDPPEEQSGPREFDPFQPVSVETAASAAYDPDPEPLPPPPPARQAAPPQVRSRPIAAADPRVQQALAQARAQGIGLPSDDGELPDAAFQSVQPVSNIPIPVHGEETDESKLTPIQRELRARGNRPPPMVSTVGANLRAAPPNPVDPAKPPTFVGGESPADVVEHPAQRVRSAPPVINPGVAGMSRNPRYARPASR